MFTQVVSLAGEIAREEEVLGHALGSRSAEPMPSQDQTPCNIQVIAASIAGVTRRVL